MDNLVIAVIFSVASITSAAPVDSPHESSYAVMLNMLIIRSSHHSGPSDPANLPPRNRKYEKFADNALYLGFNTVKIGLGMGMLTLVLTVTERLARWLYRHVRGSIQYWKDEIRDIKNGGMDPDQAAWEKDEFVNEPDDWEVPDNGKYKNRTNLYVKKSRNPRPVKWIVE